MIESEVRSVIHDKHTQEQRTVVERRRDPPPIRRTMARAGHSFRPVIKTEVVGPTFATSGVVAHRQPNLDGPKLFVRSSDGAAMERQGSGEEEQWNLERAGRPMQMRISTVSLEGTGVHEK